MGQEFDAFDRWNRCVGWWEILIDMDIGGL